MSKTYRRKLLLITILIALSMQFIITAASAGNCTITSYKGDMPCYFQSTGEPLKPE